MKAVKTQQKYKCDFCKRRSVKAAMEKHEKRCFRNPNRFCDYCENKGSTREHLVGDGINEPAYYEDVLCPFCSQRDLKKEAEIAAYEKGLEETPREDLIAEKMPF